MSQSKAILNYLKAGNSITSIEALEKFGSFRLASRILDLNKHLKEKLGLKESDPDPIQSKIIELPNGKHCAKYWLEDPVLTPVKKEIRVSPPNFQVKAHGARELFNSTAYTDY